MNIQEEFEKGNIPDNEIIIKAFYIADYRISEHINVVCSISGGSDSDIMLDLFSRVDNNQKIEYVFLNTGLEQKATKEHLKELEKKYDIKITRINYKKPIPITCRDNGQPFLSKQVSEFIERLQRHNFKWEDKPFKELYKKYPKCKAALRWWCNEWGENSKFNINYNKYLKEFMILNPPKFKISNKCCKFSKKDPVHEYINSNKAFDLNCFGVRKAEGGSRSSAYKNCYSDNQEKEKIDEFRPIFWFKDSDKKEYEEFYNITHSKCYTEYGLKRTGCAGCPYNMHFEDELKVMYKHEPNLYKAVTSVFKESYDYTTNYRNFVKEKHQAKETNKKDYQINIKDFISTDI